jgi:hypothetical protein
MPRLDLTGRKFERLFVKGLAYVKDGRTFWTCVCDCSPDRDVIIKGKYLTNGETKSCGCLNTERIRQMGQSNKKYNEYRQVEDVVYVKFSNCDEEFLCNANDWERAKNVCWYKNNTGYARGEINNKFILFHDYILDVDPNFEVEVDHISGDRLDNRRCNLRLCSRKENAYNKGLYSNNTSGATGVSWHNIYCKWGAYIQKDNNNITLGYFDLYEDAVKVRREAEVKYFGEYLRGSERIS